MQIQHQVAEILYGRSVYVKKIIEEANTVDETTKLLKVSSTIFLLQYSSCLHCWSFCPNVSLHCYTICSNLNLVDLYLFVQSWVYICCTFFVQLLAYVVIFAQIIVSNDIYFGINLSQHRYNCCPNFSLHCCTFI